MTNRCAARAHRVLVAACLLAGTIIIPQKVSAQTLPPCKRAVLTLGETATFLRIDPAVLERLAEQGTLPGRRIESEWRFNCAALMAWLAGNGLSPAPESAMPLSTEQMATVTATGGTASQAGTPPSAATPPPGEAQNRPVGEAPQERAAEEIFLRSQRVLLGPGDVVMDFGLFYGRNDDQALAAIGGGVGLATIRQQLFTTLLQARVGLFDETELFAGVTFNTQETRQFFGSTDLSRDRQGAFGGTSIGVRRTLLKEGSRRPNVIATLSGHIPNDDRPYLVGAGLVLVKSVDPAALFLNANYFRAVGRSASVASTLAPEYTVDVSVGYALALNDTLAINMAVAGLFTGAGTTVDNTRFRQPGTFSARFGVTSWLARGLYVEPSVSFGLTGPGRSFAFGLTFPYAF
jgi:hypothetical protein